VGTAIARTAQASPEGLSGRQKVAIICMALGSDSAAKLTQKMTAEEVDAISFEIARMDNVSGPMVESVLEEWLTRMLAADSLAAGGMQVAKEILEKAFGSRKAQQVLERIQSQLTSASGLYRLRNADPQQLGNMVRGEHPQTIALILTHLEPQHTANVLKELDTEIGAEVVFRMARMEKVSPELLQLIERSLGSETDLNVQQGMSASGGPAAVAAVMNFTPASLEKALLDGVHGKDAALCEQIKNLMFVFEDVGSLDNKALQRLLRDVDSKELALALKVASDDLKGKIMGAMSQRAVQALQDEMELMGPSRLKDVEAAQTNIVGIVRRLEEAGEIIIGGGDDDLVL
jgi:flagellar motor switch protein FliG